MTLASLHGLDMLSIGQATLDSLITQVTLALTRLGRRCAMLSKIHPDEKGERIAATLRAGNVDDTLLLRSDDLNLKDSDIDPAMIAHARILFLTDDLFNENHSQQAARKAIIAAKMHQTKVVLIHDDKQNSMALRTILPLCDVILPLSSSTHQVNEIANQLHAWL